MLYHGVTDESEYFLTYLPKKTRAAGCGAKIGLLLINLGTPATASIKDVRRYLREFLADTRVIHLPVLLRYLLLYGIILPFRPRISAHAYQAIWTPAGSPLLKHSQALASQLQMQLEGVCKVSLAMRYGQPTIANGLGELQECEKIIILPLYPQYSSAATGSAIAKVLQVLAAQSIIPSLTIIRDFHAHPSFIAAQAALIKPYLQHYDYILFSYHGVPENHLLIGACRKSCKSACADNVPNNPACYRAQCGRTTALLAQSLNLPCGHYSTSYQSRFGRAQWITPFTDKELDRLAALGVKRLVIVCPAFVTDCLETLEEIGIRAKQQWMQLGGESLTLIPCLNSNKEWVDAILSITHLDTPVKLLERI